MALEEKLQIRLSKEEKQKVFRLAAKRSLDTGERISASDVLRDLAMAALESSNASLTPHEAGKESLIKFKPSPEILKALKRAQINSGQSADKVINALLSDALQMEVAG